MLVVPLHVVEEVVQEVVDRRRRHASGRSTEAQDPGRPCTESMNERGAGPARCFAISSEPDAFAWAMRGGYKRRTRGAAC